MELYASSVQVAQTLVAGVQTLCLAELGKGLPTGDQVTCPSPAQRFVERPPGAVGEESSR
jgi:hypothetical protein